MLPTDLLTLAADVPVFTLEGLLSTKNLLALLTLTLLEIVLGIDNVVFIAILAGKLPPEKRDKARRVGLALALVTRILLLLTITWIMGLAKTPLLTLPFLTEPSGDPHGDGGGAAVPLNISGRDLVLILGGLFLIWKATKEIHHKLEDEPDKQSIAKAAGATFGGVVAQILLIDIVFSLDSVITAVGMAQRIEIMVAAVIISILLMLVYAGKIAAFIDKHPTMKMLALAFLMLIGVVLVADGLGQHIPKGYIYFAMAFSLGVETLNMRTRKPA
jgi:predicted tellurium resistance membrane protein TerC